MKAVRLALVHAAVALIGISSCQPSRTPSSMAPLEAVPASTQSWTPTPRWTELPQLSTHTPFLSPTVLASRCFAVQDEARPPALPSGNVLAADHLGPPMIWNPHDGHTYQLPQLQPGKVESYTSLISPDGTLVAYQEWFRNSHGNVEPTQLTLLSSAGQVVRSLPWLANWGSPHRWLDNERLLIATRDAPQGAFVILDVASGIWRTLPSTIPDLYTLWPPYWWMPEYDLSLDRVVYGATREIVLWDTQRKDPLLTLPDPWFGFHGPKWAPDGGRIAIASSSSDIPNYELYLATRDGQVLTKTRLSDAYPVVFIGEFSWSPDAHYIAFWFDGRASSDDEVSERLALLDTTTGVVTDTCIHGGSEMHNAPIWSLDSSELVLPDMASTGIQELLVDIASGEAHMLPAGRSIWGWLSIQ